MSPSVTAGGINATATITPTNTLDKPVVIDNTAAAPEANASATESRPTSVRASNSAQLYDLYEEMAIQVLDSEYASYPADTLERYLRLYLRMKRLELGLAALPEPEGD